MWPWSPSHYVSLDKCVNFHFTKPGKTCKNQLCLTLPTRHKLLGYVDLSWTRTYIRASKGRRRLVLGANKLASGVNGLTCLTADYLTFKMTLMDRLISKLKTMQRTKAKSMTVGTQTNSDAKTVKEISNDPWDSTTEYLTETWCCDCPSCNTWHTY